MIYLFLPNLYFYTIWSIATFLKVINKVHFRVLTLTEIISYYWHTPVCKTLGAVSYKSWFVWKEDFSSSVVEVLPCSGCFTGIKIAIRYRTLSNKKCYMSGTLVSKPDILFCTVSLSITCGKYFKLKLVYHIQHITKA